MSNHARGLWGYSGRTASGLELTIQATGMGGPSAALVLSDLAKLGVERAVRVGTCTGIAGRAELGELLRVTEALAGGGSVTALGLDPGAAVRPDPELLAALESSPRGEARTASVASLDTAVVRTEELPGAVAAADMQTVAVLARADQLGIASAALLIVSEVNGERLADDALEAAARKGGAAAASALQQAST